MVRKTIQTRWRLVTLLMIALVFTASIAPIELNSDMSLDSDALRLIKIRGSSSFSVKNYSGKYVPGIILMYKDANREQATKTRLYKQRYEWDLNIYTWLLSDPLNL